MNKQWRLIWFDDFKKSGLPDSTKWTYETGPPIKNEAFELFQYYTADRIENARCENGLVLEARKEEYQNAHYTSASIMSRTSWKNVRIEVRAKIPGGRGIWPAIWMLPEGFSGEGWPACGEIDLMEHIGQIPNDVFFNVNTGAFNIVMGTAKGKHYNIPSLYTEFHTYRLDWDSDKLEFFMDDDRKFQFDKLGTDDSIWPFDKPFYLKLMLGVGLLGDFPGADLGLDNSNLPAVMMIEYVRIYEKA